MSPGDFADSGHPSVGRLPLPNLEYLRAITDPQGLWEHACYSTPRREHGFCTDDNARALVVVLRQAAINGDGGELARVYLEFILAARTSSGRVHNRRDATAAWIDEVGSDDCQGRAIWGFGAAASLGLDPSMREAGFSAFIAASDFISPHLRANAYAALGALEILKIDPALGAALRLLDRTSGFIAASARTAIPWPETRLTYDNARLPEALVGAGLALADNRRFRTGIRLLEWLVANETLNNRFSFTPDGGREPGGQRPAFDQQPIEAWGVADACHRAWQATGDPKWRQRTLRAASWLLGENDTEVILYDPSTGGTCDGLTPTGANANRGAEATLSGLGALQAAAVS